MPSKTELLEENIKLIKNTIEGWASRIQFIYANIDKIGSDLFNREIDIIVGEMLKLSGVDPAKNERLYKRLKI